MTFFTSHRISSALPSARALGVVLACLTGCASSAQTPDDAPAPGDGALDAALTRDGASALDAADARAPTDAIAATDAVTAMDAVTASDTGAASDVPAMPDVRAMPDVVVPPPPPTSALLLNGTAPMSCADPTVFSEGDAEATFYVYCTGMVHVWRTSDWYHFADERSATRFDLTGMSANGQQIGAWWAPGIVYAPDLRRYVMWVSVPAAGATHGTDGWDARALAVLTADAPTGPWTFRGVAQNAGAGEHFIDPFPYRDHDGRRFVFWKQYGGGVPSRIMGAAVDSTWRTIVAGSRVEIMDGFGGTGTWEDNVRENPAVYYDAATGHHHMIFSGGHWAEDNYATGHALSSCGPLCVAGAGNWHMVDSGDRGILQVVRSFGVAAFEFGGPGGAEFQDHAARYIVYAAAARSARGDHARYLMRDRIQWRNNAPYVDTGGHHPLGF